MEINIPAVEAQNPRRVVIILGGFGYVRFLGGSWGFNPGGHPEDWTPVTADRAQAIIDWAANAGGKPEIFDWR